MADMLGNALSALTSYQRALATTSHNIANADTEGYSRQRVDFATRVPQQMGDLSIGSGVTLSDVRRVYDEFAGQQLRSASGAFSQLDNYYQLASQLDNTLSDSELDAASKAATLQVACDHDVAHRHARAERTERILEDDLHLAAHRPQLALAEPLQLAPVEPDAALAAFEAEQGEEAYTVLPFEHAMRYGATLQAFCD